MPKDHYRFDDKDPDYFDNWIQQYDMLCESKWRIGLIGSVYYAGVMITIIPVPWLADLYGRKWFTMTGFIIDTLSSIGLMLCHDLNTAYVFLFICGLTYGARIIVGTTFLIEHYWKKAKDLIVWLRMITESITIVVFTACFQFWDDHWLY